MNLMSLNKLPLETELENLIKTIDGVKDANVMISMPEQGVFINDMATRSDSCCNV